MKKLILAIFIFLVGCNSEVPVCSEQAELADSLYKALIKYELIYGTSEEQARPPITDEQVKSMQEYMKGLGK